ncbi:MAG: ATP-binding protein, partial [Planctomycetota bacterium]
MEGLPLEFRPLYQSPADPLRYRFMDSIIGQSHAKAVLTAALASGRTHHAWTFHGPVGVGKATTAKRLARVLLCHQPP